MISRRAVGPIVDPDVHWSQVFDFPTVGQAPQPRLGYFGFHLAGGGSRYLDQTAQNKGQYPAIREYR